MRELACPVLCRRRKGGSSRVDIEINVVAKMSCDLWGKDGSIRGRMLGLPSVKRMLIAAKWPRRVRTFDLSWVT